jgi:chromosome segregation ATPase
MEGDITFDSMLKEIKSDLSKYESIIKEIETYHSKKKLTEAENIQKKIAQKIKMVKTISKTEDDNFLLESYSELNSELNKRLTIANKRQEKNNKEKNKYKDLINSSNKNPGNLENINILDDEQQALKNCIKMSSDITNTLKETNEELDNQGKRLDENSEKVVKTLQKMPVIGKMLGEVRYYKIREKLIIGCVVGVICFIMLYVTFHRRS